MKLSPLEAKKDITKLFILCYMSLIFLIILFVMFYEDLMKLEIGSIYIIELLKNLDQFSIFI
jgi:hypothetical protein